MIQGEIRTAMGAVCKGKAVPGSGAYTHSEGLHPIVMAGDMVVYESFTIEEGWTPQSLRETELVACSKRMKDAKLESCGGYGTTENEVFLARERWVITVYAAHTGEVLTKVALIGPPPGHGCPQYVDEGEHFLTGGQPHYGAIRDLLKPLVDG